MEIDHEHVLNKIIKIDTLLYHKTKKIWNKEQCRKIKSN
jgi:hypothetical protein